MEQELRDLLQKVSQCAQDAVKAGIAVVPTGFFIKNNKVIDVAVFQTAGDENDKYVFMTLATKAALLKCDGIILINDVYMSKIKDEDTKAPGYKFVQPSKDPNRIQCVLVNYVASDKKDHTITIPYEENNLGIKIKEDQIEWVEDTEMRGLQGEIIHRSFELSEDELKMADKLLDKNVYRGTVNTQTGKIEESNLPNNKLNQDPPDNSYPELN